jgi:hypothetical protein
LTPNQELILLVIVGVVVTLALLYGILLVWPLALVLVIAGYLISGATGVVVGLIAAGIVGLIILTLHVMES